MGKRQSSEINDRGVLVDQAFAESAQRVVEAAEDALDRKMAAATNYEVTACSNRNQIMAFLALRGVAADSIKKEALEELLAVDSGIPDDVRAVLTMRRSALKPVIKGAGKNDKLLYAYTIPADYELAPDLKAIIELALAPPAP